MKALWAVCRLIGLVIWLLLWVLALPFIIAWLAIKLAIARAVFRAQLSRYGMPREHAVRMSRRYTISFSDCIRLIKGQRLQS